MRRIFFAVALVLGAAAWSWLLTAMARQSGHAPAAHVGLPDLDELEARTLWAGEGRRAWEGLARRHQGGYAIACAELADAATRREVR